MARLFFAGVPVGTACASCGRQHPKLYDEHREQYYCDFACLAEYVGEHAEEFAKEYAESNVVEED